jgi:hypothetical protein
LHDIGVALRDSLELFLNLGLISGAGGEVTWQLPHPQPPTREMLYSAKTKI